jgi:uncharacterized protein (TIGR02680 family)
MKDDAARFKPTRAGIINVWDYVDEEFVFGDGRLALRGHNGSGKTKALEVLFPFILDGSLDARRLDPFSGENRTMKSNLLYRGQESEYGYVWMEFARRVSEDRGARMESVTLVIGLQAHRSWDRPRASFYVTDSRVGVDFGLIGPDFRPLTAKQLTAVLGREARHHSKQEYQNAVDERLFGLGPQRYTQLLDLLIALRRPLLAKDLDPVKVSATLTAGLSPVDDELVEQAARDFENLHAVQSEYDNLFAADTAVSAFLEDYKQYLRVYARNQLIQVEARLTAAGEHVDKLAEAARSVAAAERGVARTKERTEDVTRQVGILDARRNALNSLDAVIEHESLVRRRTELDKTAAELNRDQAKLARAATNIAELSAEAESVAAELAQKRRDGDRLAQELVQAAEVSGIAEDGQGPADTGDDLPETAKARAAIRDGEIAEVRELQTAAETASVRHRTAHEAHEAARTDTGECGAAYADAEKALDAQRTAALDALRDWARRWIAEDEYAVVLQGEVEPLAAVLAAIGEVGAPSLAEAFAGQVQARRAGLGERRGTLRARLEALDQEIDARQTEHDTVAAQRDEAPPATDRRPASREGRPGAPLWRLVDYAESVTDEQAAALEGALYGAGLLDAWIHPDEAAASAAWHTGQGDACITALPPQRRPRGRTLADLLVVEEQDVVPGRIVADVLASVAVLESDASEQPAEGAAFVTLAAHYTLGPLAGARPKAAAEYIGATNRAQRRRARLAELSSILEDLHDARRGIEQAIGALDDAEEAFDRAAAELPPTSAITTATKKLETAAALLAAARTREGNARQVMERKAAELDAARRTLRREASRRNLPADAAALVSVARAVADFVAAAADLATVRANIQGLKKRHEDAEDRIGRLSRDHEEDTDAYTEAFTEYETALNELEAREATVGTEYTEAMRQLRAVEEDLGKFRGELKDLNATRETLQTQRTVAERDQQHERESIAAAVTELFAQLEHAEPVLHHGLRDLLNITEPGTWPTVWPTAAQVATRLAELAEDPDGSVVGTAAVRAQLPDQAAGILTAYEQATRGGRAPTENMVATAADRVWEAFRELEAALKTGDDGYQAQMSGQNPLIVEVVGADGRSPVAAFAREIADALADQAALLEQREKTVLEDALLTSLAQQIHERVLAARDLVAAMDTDTRSKPMSSGTVIGIGWIRAEGLSEHQFAASRVLESDATSLGERGLEELRSLIRAMIHEHRARRQRDTYREALAAVLDYRAWHLFELRLTRPGGRTEKLTRTKHSQMSGGEKSASIHMPLFAAANALYSSAKPSCPRMVALDEAFAGIDSRFTPDLLGLTVKFDLDLFMTGHDLWVRYPEVPTAVHYDLHHDESTHTVSALLILWDGTQLIDAGAGFAGNDDLARELLGITPTRRMPQGSAPDLLALADESGDERSEAGSTEADE